MEKWKKIPKIKSQKTGDVFRPYGYEVSNMGRVRSYRNRYSGYGKKKFVKVPFIINARLDQNGYPLYLLYQKDGRRKNIRGHVLVAHAFIGRRKKGMHICHYDDIKTNNKLSNLRYDTVENNALDRIRNNKK
jgi:hypothetical protein